VKLSIIIVSYNRCQMLRYCIKSIIRYTQATFEIIIWDNASNEEGKIEYLKSLELFNKNIRVIFSDVNIGCGKGRNCAVKYASGEYVIFLDDDMILTPTWEKDLIKQLKRENNLIAVSSTIVNIPGNKIMLRGCTLQEYGNVMKISSIDNQKLYTKNSLLSQDHCDVVGGGGVLFKKLAFQEAQIDKNYERALEDFDFSLQLKKSGYNFSNSSKSIIFHRHTRFNSDFANYNEVRYDLNKMSKDFNYFSKKWGKLLLGTLEFKFKADQHLGDFITGLLITKDILHNNDMKKYFCSALLHIYNQDIGLFQIYKDKISNFLKTFPIVKYFKDDLISTRIYNIISKMETIDPMISIKVFKILAKSPFSNISSGSLYHIEKIREKISA